MHLSQKSIFLLCFSEDFIQDLQVVLMCNIRVHGIPAFWKRRALRD